MELNELKDNTAAEAPSDAQKGVQNLLGVIKVIESLFHAINAGSFPMAQHDEVMNGMNFLSQFHKQLLEQLPADVKATIFAKPTEANAGVVANEVVAGATNEPVKA